ncbi:hypothetical protein [Hasllibacter sp. MH4015]|uniref:hypothetical protein n=1 Tax=Hasllibacter sp. MH4015 TaxID=2854029 RepID=UPI001CD4C551|nr:hypothetical protein [Hasllibacter sp. MH4015]
MTLNDFPTELEIDEYAFGFYGYGDLEAPLWFVGMEEGGGNSAADVTQRVQTWQDRGRRTVDDVAEFHDAIIDKGFASITNQPTWTMLSRIQLGFDQGAEGARDPKKHWQTILGRQSSKTCVLELNPLPSPSTSKWKYPEFTDYLFLANREVYNLRYRAKRIQTLKNLIEERSPKAVVFFGRMYQPFWEVIAGGLFGSGETPRILENGATTFVSMDHPNARVPGRTKDALARLGAQLATV